VGTVAVVAGYIRALLVHGVSLRPSQIGIIKRSDERIGAIKALLSDQGRDDGILDEEDLTFGIAWEIETILNIFGKK
jgi:hypothetical protein